MPSNSIHWQRSWRWTSTNKNDQGSKTVGLSNCKRPTSTLCPGRKQIDLNIGDSLPGGVQLNGMAVSTATLLSAILPSAVSRATWYLDQHSLSLGLSLARLAPSCTKYGMEGGLENNREPKLSLKRET
jgi:hypothetical protein